MRNAPFNEYHFMLVKSGRIWCLDFGSWDFQEVQAAKVKERLSNPKAQVILCTSPTDDDTVIQKIIKAYNR
jgi:hypothetical protein